MKRRQTRRIVTAGHVAGVLLGVTAGAAVGCAPRPSGAAPVVAVSVAPLAYFVDRIGEGVVEVEIMVPPGANPTTFEPSIRQMRAVSRAALYVKVGHPAFAFEAAWLDEMLRDAGDLRIVDAAHGVPDVAGDPHLWVSPRIAAGVASRVADALSVLMPEHEEAFARRLAELTAEIDALDREVRARIPAAGTRRFVVFHPAWTYFAAEYGLEQVAIERDGKEPSAGELARRITEFRAARVPVIFIQPQFSAASAQLLAEEIGATTVVVDPLSRDWLPALREAAFAITGGLVP